MKRRYNGITLILMLVVGAAIGCVACLLLFPLKFGSAEAYSAAGKFATIYNTVSRYYVGDADMETGTDIAYDALVQYSTDQWSYYMTPEGFESYKDYQNNSYSGIGVTLTPAEDGGYKTVYSVTEDSPAQLAGISPGELLIAMDGEDLAGKSVTEIKELLTAKGDSEFTMTVRGADGADREVSLAAAQIYTKPVEYSLLDGNVGYVKIKNFEERAGAQTVAAVNELIDQGAESLVFDLRNDPGGLLSELLTALDRLLPEGDMFVAEDKEGKEIVTGSDGVCVELPMAVLINKDTYSAAEFFSAALREYNMAVLVGAPTTGKSHSQETIALTDGSAIHISTSRYLTPHRVDLAEQGGLKPDLEVELSQEDSVALTGGKLSYEEDPQLQEAIKAVNE